MAREFMREYHVLLASLVRLYHVLQIIFTAISLAPLETGAAASVIIYGRHGHTDVPNFVATRYLADGEREVWLHVAGITARETAVFRVGEKQQGIRLWQVTDGRHFIQSIYDVDRQLRDCEYLKDEDLVDNFIGSFGGLFASARALKEDRGGNETESLLKGGLNQTLRLLRGRETLENEFGHVLDYPQLRSECKRLHHLIRLLAKEQRQRARKAKHHPGDTTTPDTQHRNHDDEVDDELLRLKRDIFIYPGTNWCGIGSSTDKYNELGFNAAADRCCRQHDYCAHIIEGFTTKYNLFNYRFHTISHCDCDERFRTCLKMVNNGASNMVGKLFFNIVQTRCFVLKSEKVCSKRSWWGKCLKYELQKTAHLRDAIPY